VQRHLATKIAFPLPARAFGNATWRAQLELRAVLASARGTPTTKIIHLAIAVAAGCMEDAGRLPQPGALLRRPFDHGTTELTLLPKSRLHH